MAVTIDDLFEAAANGVIRALEARKAGQQSLTDVADASTAALVRSGFFVDVHIRAGGIPGVFEQPQAFLNPQPLPPGRQ
jgi:uncharacterized protein YbjT (DUF2867 family)